MKNLVLFLIFFFTLSLNKVFAGHCSINDDKQCPAANTAEEYASCMIKSMSALTDSCKIYINLLKDCSHELSKFCSHVDSEHATLACLGQNANNLSSKCSSAISIF